MNDNFSMTFSDAYLICKKKKKIILWWTLGLAFLVAFLQLLRPVQYQAKSTFREKSKTASDSNKSLSLAMLVGAGDLNENAALSLFKSRNLAEQVVVKKNLQANLRRDAWNFHPIKNIFDHLKVDWALFRNVPEPVIPDSDEPIKVIDVVYADEKPVKLKIRFISENAFVVSDKKGNKISSHVLGEAVLGPNYSFVLVRQNEGPLKETRFNLTIDAVAWAAAKHLLRFKCESDTKDKCFIKLTYRHPSRYEASDYLNTLMALYQAYLRHEHRRISHEQIAYLNKRQEDAGVKLKTMMEEHAHALTNNMATIDFLFQTQQSYTQKLLLIDMELRRLQKARKEGIVFYERYWIDGGDPATINQILSTIREHKQQADSIDIALRNVTPENPETLKLAFAHQIEELENIRSYQREAKALFAAMQEGKPLPAAVKLSNNPKYMIKEWREKTGRNETNSTVNFNAYLANLIHLLEVEEKIAQERLQHQQGLQLEFQGIDLSTANQLYINYSKSLNENDAEILHDEFILQQMKEPNFEPSSLSSVLEDPVSREIITRASNLLLMSRDQDNRSQKELERLRSELAQQKEFLALHLEQTIQLLNLRKKLFREKLLSVQNAQLELIQQKISVLEQHLADYIDSRIANMKQERAAIEQQQNALKAEMEKMPEKWSSEKLIEQHLEMNKKMIEEITKMVESKNISAHIDISQSAPVDSAVIPIHPLSSHFFLFGILGAILGFLTSVSFILGKAIVNGIPATPNGLKFYERKVAGSLSNHKLDALRRLTLFLKTSGQSVMLMTSSGEDYSQKLAELLSKSGFKVLLMPLCFDKPSTPENLPGLLDYLEKKATIPKIIKKEYYDYIASGGLSSCANELILSPSFKNLMAKLIKDYDLVIAVSHVVPTNAEGDSLTHLFDQTVISITHETLKELEPYFKENIFFIFS